MTNSISATIQLTGDVQGASFPPWILRHATKLGLVGVSIHPTIAGLEVEVCGAEEMIQALALGASLGPADVLVDSVQVTTEG